MRHWSGTKYLDEYQTVENGHGRQETRTYAVATAPETVDPEGQWQDLNAVGIAISERLDSKGRHSVETRYFIMSRPLSAQEFANAVRGHWSIEMALAQCPPRNKL